MLFVIPAFLYLILAKGYSTKNLGVVITFLLSVIDDISRFMNTVSNLENWMVSFDRCRNYLKIEPEEGYKHFAPIEETIYKTNKKRLEFKKIEKNLETEELSQNDSLDEPLLEDTKFRILKTPSSQNGILIELNDVKVKYSPDLPYVLKGISLTIQPGEKVGIIGRTGAGKTSFVNLLVRFFDEYEGSIKLNNLELKRIYLESLRQQITFISQDSYFFEGTIRENLDPRGLFSDEKILDLLKEGEIFDKVMLNGGLDWVLNSKTGGLSVGEKQVLCFLRAIINTKGLIIMDEATSNLDVKSEDVLERLKEKYMDQATLLVIAHRLNTIHSCDKVLILESGEVQQFVAKKDISESQLNYFKNYLRMFD